MNNRVRILSTAPLDAALVQQAAAAGVDVDVQPLVEVQRIVSESLTQNILEIAAVASLAVFTSVNAVAAVAEQVGSVPPEWMVYCTQGATAEAIRAKLPGCTIAATGKDAAELAAIMLAAGVRDVFFFCGDKRMDTLPVALKKRGAAVTEVVVYETVQVPQQIYRIYEGILFFSPSGVSSFFIANMIDADTVLFAIGNTTAAALQQQSNNKIVVAAEPSRENIVNTAIRYFSDGHVKTTNI